MTSRAMISNSLYAFGQSEKRLWVQCIIIRFVGVHAFLFARQEIAVDFEYFPFHHAVKCESCPTRAATDQEVAN